MQSDVVVTGLGTVSALGPDYNTFRRAVLTEEHGFSPIRHSLLEGRRAHYAATIQFPINEGPEGRFVQLARLAAREALADAGIDPVPLASRFGLILGTCSGPLPEIEAHYARIAQGEGSITTEEFARKQIYTGVSVLAGELGIQGLATTVVTACSASTTAILMAAQLIRLGVWDAALAGGSDVFSTSMLAGFEALKATSPGLCAPFSRPTGMLLGEAGAFLVLESSCHARERHAEAYATFLGGATSNDAYHCSSPHPGGEGLALAISRTLDRTGLKPEDITYINAHGTGTEANDKAETKGLIKALGERGRQIPLSSTKSMTGHCLGATGAMEVAASLAGLEAEVFPPNANFTDSREGCALNCVTEAGKAWQPTGAFISCNSAFGGHNACLAFSPLQQVEGKRRPMPRQRVFLSGCGMVTSAGMGLAPFLEALRTGAAALESWQVNGDVMEAGRVNNAEVERFDRRLQLRSMEPASKWATLASKLALSESHWKYTRRDLREVGLFLAVSGNPAWAEQEWLEGLYRNQFKVEHVGAFPYMVPCSVAGNVCHELHIMGLNATLCEGPDGALSTLALAAAAIAGGEAAVLLAGGVDQLSERRTSDRISAGHLAPGGNAPGGEGAVVWMLESEEHLHSRGGRAIAAVESVAWATQREVNACCAKSLFAPMIEEALTSADLDPDAPISRAGNLYSEENQAAHIIGKLELADPLVSLAVELHASHSGNDKLLFATVSPQGGGTALVLTRLDTGEKTD